RLDATLHYAPVPHKNLNEKMMETPNTKPTYRHTVIGYLEDIKNMPAGYDYSRQFFRRYYTPDDATLFIVGDFDRQATLALIEKAYGGWSGKVETPPVPVEPKQKGARRAAVGWGKPTPPRLCVAWPAPPPPP